MKTGKIILIAAAVSALVACVGEPKDTTRLSGTVLDSAVTEISIRVGDVDTVLAVVDGAFEIELPADVETYGLLMDSGRRYGTYFISDGTKVSMTFADGDISVKTSPEYLESNYVAYQEKATPLYEAEDMAALETLWFETVKANPGNALAVLVVSDAMYTLEPEKMLEMISYIQEPVRSQRFVSSREKEAGAQLKTKEGMMFTDFTVEHVYGYDRSMDPQPLKKEVKFSDYVGKGKYVLVDFWSPWCGPCRREIPNIQEVYSQYKNKGLEVLSIAVWERQPQSHTIEVAGELGMDWLHINNAGSVPTEIYGIGGIPHLMLIGPDGTILKRGFHGLEGIQEAVAEYIK